MEATGYIERLSKTSHQRKEIMVTPVPKHFNESPDISSVVCEICIFQGVALDMSQASLEAETGVSDCIFAYGD